MISRISNQGTYSAKPQRNVAFGEARHTLHSGYLIGRIIGTDLTPKQEQAAIVKWIKAVAAGHVQKWEQGSFLNKIDGDSIKIRENSLAGTCFVAENKDRTEKVDFWTNAQTDSTMTALHESLIEELGKVN